MKHQNVFICQICKEPISNFLCIDCIARDFGSCLSKNIRGKFMEFHNTISGAFRSSGSGFRPCFKCGMSDAAPVCTMCYSTELHSWFKGTYFMKEVKKMYSFDFRKHENLVKQHRIASVTEIGSGISEEFGICDECGEYSDELRCVDGKWVCRECSQMD